jgi:hypothetical protein
MRRLKPRPARPIDRGFCRDKIIRMALQHPESLYYPYTKRSLTAVRCVFSTVALVLIAVCIWRIDVVIGVVFLGLVWLIYEVAFRSHRRRREEILSDGQKITRKNRRQDQRLPKEVVFLPRAV